MARKLAPVGRNVLIVLFGLSSFVRVLAGLYRFATAQQATERVWSSIADPTVAGCLPACVSLHRRLGRRDRHPFRESSVSNHQASWILSLGQPPEPPAQKHSLWRVLGFINGSARRMTWPEIRCFWAPAREPGQIEPHVESPTVLSRVTAGKRRFLSGTVPRLLSEQT
jgi:hypothetical protein